MQRSIIRNCLIALSCHRVRPTRNLHVSLCREKPILKKNVAIARQIHNHNMAGINTTEVGQSANSEIEQTQQEAKSLPKLSPQEHKIYNRLSERMNMFVCPPSLNSTWNLSTN
jgi:hypothetical protein